MRKNFFIWAARIAVLVGLAVVLWFVSAPKNLELITKASYSCDGGKTVSAAFYKKTKTNVVVPGQPPVPNGEVRLLLSDGRQMDLPQTISADGIRYADSNESFVFWGRGDGAFIMENGTTTYSNCLRVLPQQSFTNPSGGYGFSVPDIWNTAINQYNNKDSLFGPNAGASSGFGGVEVFPNQSSISSFLEGMAAVYSNKTDITVDGVSGVMVDYKAYPQSGEQVVLLRNGTIYNIYINSINSDEVGYFRQVVVPSFKFAVSSVSIASPTNGDVWNTGSTHKITWLTDSIPAGNKISITIRRIPPPPLQANGQEFDPIVFVNLDNTGSIDWTISGMYPTGTYVLGVTSYASIPVKNPILGESAPFTIKNLSGK